MLLQIDLPDVYENAIVDTQVVIQQTSTAKKI
jgi:regulator of protease activity HflC (stomatin/prohibitin superfamily)